MQHSFFDVTLKFTVLQRHFYKFCDTPSIYTRTLGIILTLCIQFSYLFFSVCFADRARRTCLQCFHLLQV